MYVSRIRILFAFEIVNPPSPEMDVLYETPEREKCLLSRHFSLVIINFSQLLVSVQISQKMTNKKIDPSNKPAYIVALLILVISVYFVKYESDGFSEKRNTPCQASDALWISRLELLGLNHSRIVKRCSPNYNDVVKVNGMVLRHHTNYR